MAVRRFSNALALKQFHPYPKEDTSGFLQIRFHKAQLKPTTIAADFVRYSVGLSLHICRGIFGNISFQTKDNVLMGILKTRLNESFRRSFNSSRKKQYHA